MDSDVHSSVLLTFEASVLINLAIKSARKLLFGPPATVGLCLCSAATHDVSCDSHGKVEGHDVERVTEILKNSCL